MGIVFLAAVGEHCGASYTEISAGFEYLTWNDGLNHVNIGVDL